MKLNIIKKALRYILTGILFVVAGLFLWLQLGVYSFTDEDDRKSYLDGISNAPQLPQSFVTVYAKVYPERFDSNVYTLILYRFMGKRISTPSLETSLHYMSSRRRGDMYYIMAATAFTERNFSQEQCLNYYFEQLDFTHNTIGIESAAHYYYRKPFADLNNNEILELLVMAKNPSFFNKNRHNNSHFKNAYAKLKKQYYTAP